MFEFSRAFFLEIQEQNQDEQAANFTAEKNNTIFALKIVGISPYFMARNSNTT